MFPTEIHYVQRKRTAMSRSEGLQAYGHVEYEDSWFRIMGFGKKNVCTLFIDAQIYSKASRQVKIETGRNDLCRLVGDNQIRRRVSKARQHIDSNDLGHDRMRCKTERAETLRSEP